MANTVDNIKQNIISYGSIQALTITSAFKKIPCGVYEKAVEALNDPENHSVSMEVKKQNGIWHIVWTIKEI